MLFVCMMMRNKNSKEDRTEIEGNTSRTTLVYKFWREYVNASLTVLSRIRERIHDILEYQSIKNKMKTDSEYATLLLLYV